MKTKTKLVTEKQKNFNNFQFLRNILTNSLGKAMQEN